MMYLYLEDLKTIDFKKVLALYKSLGWTRYTNAPKDLERAFLNSTYTVFAFEDDELIALARSVSDDVSIHYLQDILVSEKFQRKSIGKTLIKKCLDRFSHVRMHVLLTDDEDKQKSFYESVGYKNIKDLKETKLNAYAKALGTKLI